MIKGFFFAILAIPLYICAIHDYRKQKQAALMMFAVTLPYMLYVAVIVWHEGRISGLQYLAMCSVS